MEPVPQSYVANQQILAAELNDLCRRAVGAAPADSNNFLANGATVTPGGITRIVWLQGVTGNFVATGNLCVVDASINWRDRIIVAKYAELTNANRSPGGAGDYLFDVGLAERCAYTGKGGRDAGNNAPTAGNPPVPATLTSWAMQVVSGLWLYADPSTGALTLYNNTGSTVTAPFLLVETTAKTGLRP